MARTCNLHGEVCLAYNFDGCEWENWGIDESRSDGGIPLVSPMRGGGSGTRK